MGFPGGSVVKNLPAKAGDLGLIPDLGRSPGEGNGNPLQYSCLADPMDKRAWGLQFMGSQWVRHNLATKQQQETKYAVPKLNHPRDFFFHSIFKNLVGNWERTRYS